MHLEGRILSTVARESPLRGMVANELSSALILKRSEGKGMATVYRSQEEQVENLNRVWKQFKALGNVWTHRSEAVFQKQISHASKGCLQRRHPTIPSHTSGNENWHGRLNSLTKGHASSLTTVVALLQDAALRFNLKITISHLSQPFNSPSRLFRAATKGSHHLFLLEDVLRKREKLFGTVQPHFLNIYPEHHFGLVSPGTEYVNH